jgi:hypothetical protein
MGHTGCRLSTHLGELMVEHKLDALSRFALAVLVVVVCGCGRESSSPRAADSIVTVAIGGPTRDVSKTHWPMDSDTLSIQKPATIQLRFPNGRSWSCHSQITFLSRKEELVSQVEVTPLEKTANFASAVSELQKILDELGIATDSPARERLKDWQAEPPSWDPFATKTLAAEVGGVELFAQIKPAGDENRWFLVCSFYESRLFKPADDN